MAVRSQALRQWNYRRRCAHTNNWVANDKWLLRNGLWAQVALPPCSAPKRSGTGRAVTECGDQRGRSDRDTRKKVRLHFHRPWMSLTVSIPPENLPDCRLTRENTSCCRLTAYCLFRKRGGKPHPGASESQPSSAARRGWRNFDSHFTVL